MAYRPVAKLRLCKQQPLLGNGSVIMRLQPYNDYWRRRFLFGSCKVVIGKTVEFTVDKSSARSAVTRRPESDKLKNLHC
jgi:hypothetical protein